MLFGMAAYSADPQKKINDLSTDQKVQELDMKERLDVLLVKRNLAESREKAKAIIMSGNVFVDGEREDKAGTSFSDDVSIEIKGHTLPYVSRAV